MLSPRGIVVTELFEDLKDGFVLYNICEVILVTASAFSSVLHVLIFALYFPISSQILGKGKMRQYGKLSTGKMR